MARLLTDGAESGDMSRCALSSPEAVSSGTKRTGSYSYQVTDSINMGYEFPSSLTEFYVRWAFNALSIFTAHRILQWNNSAGSEAGSLRFESLGGSTLTLGIYSGTTQRATATVTWAVGQWHVFEVHVKIDASGNFDVKYDGTTVITFSGATNAQSNMKRLYFHGLRGDVKSFVDDIAFNDTSGGVDNSWIGDGGVLAALVPNGAGNYTDLVASTGNAYQCVDEIPVSTTTTWGDYAYESTIDKKSTYAMSDVAGLPTGASIARVWVELAAGESAAEGGKVATLLRSNTTDSQGSDQALTLALARYISAEYLTDPQDSAAWTSAKVNALEAGAVVR